MNNKILIGSIIAITILIGVSFTSVVGYNSVESDVKISPLFNVRSSRAINQEGKGFTTDYVGKGEESVLSIPKYCSRNTQLMKGIDIISKMDDVTFDRFISLVIFRLNQDDKIKDTDTQDIIITFHRLRTHSDELKEYIVRGNENDFYDNYNYTFGNWNPGCFIIYFLLGLFIIFTAVIFVIFLKSTFYWSCNEPPICD